MRGFTIIELLVTVAVLAIVLSVGVPSFVDLIRNNRAATEANLFIGALSVARSEAIKRGSRVTICKTSDQLSCTTSGDWAQGWLVFADPNENASVDAGEPVIQVYQPLDGTTLAGNTLISDYISYIADGTTKKTDGGLQNGTVSLCRPPTGRSIVINKAGRVRVEKQPC